MAQAAQMETQERCKYCSPLAGTVSEAFKFASEAPWSFEEEADEATVTQRFDAARLCEIIGKGLRNWEAELVGTADPMTGLLKGHNVPLDVTEALKKCVGGISKPWL